VRLCDVSRKGERTALGPPAGDSIGLSARRTAGEGKNVNDREDR
jgi:hypothetical protein